MIYYIYSKVWNSHDENTGGAKVWWILDNKKTRRNLMFPDNLAAQIAVVRRQTGAQSDSEVLSKAFDLYREILRNGGAAYIRKINGSETKIIPI